MKPKLSNRRYKSILRYIGTHLLTSEFVELQGSVYCMIPELKECVFVDTSSSINYNGEYFKFIFKLFDVSGNDKNIVRSLLVDSIYILYEKHYFKKDFNSLLDCLTGVSFYDIVLHSSTKDMLMYYINEYKNKSDYEWFVKV